MNTKELWVNEFTKRDLKVPDLINEMQPVVHRDNITSIAALDEFLNEICSLADRELIQEISYSEPNEGELEIVITKDYEAISDRLITIIAKQAEIDYDSAEYAALIDLPTLTSTVVAKIISKPKSNFEFIKKVLDDIKF